MIRLVFMILILLLPAVTVNAASTGSVRGGYVLGRASTEGQGPAKEVPYPYVHLIGADPTNTVSSTTAFINALTELNRLGGGTLVIDPGTYKIDATIDCSSACAQTADWVIQFAPGAKLVAASTLQTPVLKIFDAVHGAHSLEINNAWIDTSLTPCVQGGPCALGYGVAIWNAYQRTATINDIYCVGSPDGTHTNSHSEDCWTPVANYRATMSGGYIRGFWGGGVYASGDLISNSPESKYNVIVKGATFWHNGAAFECKFSLYSCVSEGNNYYFNYIAMGTFWAGSEPPPFSFISTGDTIKYTTVGGRPWHIQGGTSATITNNYVEDVGVLESGGSCSLAGPSSFLYLEGGTNVIFSNNHLIQRGCYPVVSLPAILVTSAVLNGIPYNGGAIIGSDNIFENINIGLYEATVPGSNIQPSSLRNTGILNVATPISSATGSVTGTIFDYYNTVTGVATHTVTGRVAGFIGDIKEQSLASVGTLNPGIMSSPQMYSLPGVAAGDTVVVTPVTAQLIASAIDVRCRGSGDAVQCLVYNGTASTINFATLEGGSPALVRLEVRRGN